MFTAPACLQALEAAKKNRLQYDRTTSGAVYLNTPRLIEDQNQQPVWTWQQGEPFGDSVPNQTPGSAGAFVFNLRFPGQYADVETGISYNYFRDYDPTGGRYVQSDPIGLRGRINTYAYARSAPLWLYDSTGLQAACGCQSDSKWLDPWHDNPRVPPGSSAALPPDDDPPPPPRSKPKPPPVVPDGAIAGDEGARLWGQRHGVPSDEAGDIFHDIKKGERGKPGSKAADVCTVDPDTGDVFNEQGDQIGNLGQGR